MGSSIIPNLDLRAQVQGGGQGQLPQADIAGAFLQALFAARQNRQHHDEFQAQQVQEAERIRIANEQLALAKAAADRQAAQEIAGGLAFQTLFGGGPDVSTSTPNGASGGVSQQGLPWQLQGSMPGAPSSSPGPTFLNPLLGTTPALPSPSQPPMSVRRPTPSVSPPGTPISTQDMGPLARMATALRTMDPAAIPDFIRGATPLLQFQLGLQEKAEGIKRADDTLRRTIKDPLQLEAAQGLVAMAESGLHPSQEVAQQFYPQLKELAVIQPEVWRTAMEFYRQGQTSWGVTRRAFGIPKSDIPDALVYPGAPGARSGAPNEAQAEAQQQLPLMLQNHAIINGLEDQGVRLDWKGSYTMRNREGFWRDAVNTITDKNVQQLVAANVAWADAYNVAAHSRRASDKDMEIAMSIAVGHTGDTDQTLAQKRLFRQVMNQAVADKSAGRISAVGIVDQVAQQARWNPQISAFLKQERARITREQQDVARGIGPIQATDEPVTPEKAPDLVAKYGARLRALTPAQLGKGPRSPQIATPAVPVVPTTPAPAPATPVEPNINPLSFLGALLFDKKNYTPERPR